MATDNLATQEMIRFPRYEYFDAIKPDEGAYINVTSSLHHICTHHCATHKDCLFVNYNIGKKVCSLSKTPCYEYVADEEFVVTNLGPEPLQCAKWAPYARYTTSNTVTVNPCSTHPAYITCAVGRVVHSTHKLLGKYHDNVHKLWYVADGKVIDVIKGTSDVEFLDVENGCQVVWVPYSAGDSLPMRAVAGGYISGGGVADTDLYVIRGGTPGYTVVGYYNPKTLRGYVAHGGTVPQEVMQMELLTLV